MLRFPLAAALLVPILPGALAAQRPCTAVGTAQARPRERVADLDFGEVPCGTHAIRLYHDRNDNARAAFGPPSWDAARFEIAGPLRLEITLR